MAVAVALTAGVVFVGKSCQALSSCFDTLHAHDSREVVGAVAKYQHNILSDMPFVWAAFFD